MAFYFIHRPILIDRPARALHFLTFAILFLIPLHNLYASSDNMDADTTLLFFGQPGDETPLANEERHQKYKQILDYIRKEAPGWVPGLKSVVSSPVTWVESQLGLEGYHLSNTVGSDSHMTAFLPPVSLQSDPSSETDGQTLLLPPQYHHKGFLPTHDALMIGVSSHNAAMDNAVQFGIHPFCGQNWMGQTGYWGTEIEMGFGGDPGHPADRPWGKIALRYTNGDHMLMDNNRGYDVHSEINLAENVSLNSGIRQNDSSIFGNYVLLRWKLLGD